MSAANLTIDVTEETFKTEVLEAPEDTLVVVDFWADWCAPCKMAAPILERAVAAMEGRARLAKVDVDREKGLARAFGVQGIPAIKVFREGKLVEEFVGALPEKQIVKILQGLLPSAADDLVSRAGEKIETGDRAGARALLTEALKTEGGHDGAQLLLAQLCLEDGDTLLAQEYAASVDPGSPQREEAEAVLNRLSFAELCEESGGLESTRTALEQDADDNDARYRLGCCLAAVGEYEDALETLLAVISKDRNYRDGAAKEAMVRIFGIIGQRSEMADAYRQKLQQILY